MATTVEDLTAALGPLRLPRKYVPIEPHAKQEWFLRRDEFEVFFGGAAGPGKLLNCATPVPTPSGWTTIGELQVGDEVFGEDGKPYAVEWLSDIDLRPESYRLTFDDGSEIEACADHLWLTFDAKELAALTRRNPEFRARRRAARPSRAVAESLKPWVSTAVAERNRTANPAVSLGAPGGTVRTTREIYETLRTARGRTNHAVPVTEPLELPDADLPVDPYVLGAWLGDGTSTAGSLTAHPDDQPHLYEQLAAYSPHSVKDPKTVATYGLQTDLRLAGVFRKKHVPDVYLRASRAQRLALLQGLMDTDGSIDSAGTAEFSNTRECLAKAVHELACSLGQKPRIVERRAVLNGRDCGPAWRVTFTPTIPVFRLARKLARINPAPRRTSRFRYIVGCDPIPPKPMRCIRVSNPKSLFLVGRTMIPTHNSWSLLMSALQWVDTPDYHAMLFRPTLTEFDMAGGLIELSHKWLGPTDASWNGSKRQWTFPSGATVRFAYLRKLSDLTHYPGGGVSFLGFDELTLITEQLYLGVFRLLRQALGGPLDKVPLRVRSASNPGNVGHGWVKGRFITPETREPGAVFVPATIHDNPSLDYETYINTVLGHMHPVDRLRLVGGDWDVMEEGGKFKREDFELVDPDAVPQPVQQLRYWDLAATEPSQSNPDPDWTVGILYSLDADAKFTVRDIVMARVNDDEVEKIVKATARIDGTGVSVYIEQDPGQAGKAQITNYQRRVLQGYPVHAGSTRIRGVPAAKIVRASAVSAAVGNGLVRLVRGQNFREFLGQCAMFPNEGTHDDCVDALSGAHNACTQRGGTTTISVPRRRLASATAVDRITAERR